MRSVCCRPRSITLLREHLLLLGSREGSIVVPALDVGLDRSRIGPGSRRTRIALARWVFWTIRRQRVERHRGEGGLGAEIGFEASTIVPHRLVGLRELDLLGVQERDEGDGIAGGRHDPLGQSDSSEDQAADPDLGAERQPGVPADHHLVAAAGRSGARRPRRAARRGRRADSRSAARERASGPRGTEATGRRRGSLRRRPAPRGSPGRGRPGSSRSRRTGRSCPSGRPTGRRPRPARC